MGVASVCDKAKSGRPLTATDRFHQGRVEEMIWENCQIRQKDIVLKLAISKERVGHFINRLWFWKVCDRWVPQKLTDEMKAERVRVSRELLHCSEEEGEQFLWWIVSDRWWKLGPSLWSWEQKSVHGILPQRISSAKEIQNQNLCWKSHVDCIPEVWRCCTD